MMLNALIHCPGILLLDIALFIRGFQPKLKADATLSMSGSLSVSTRRLMDEPTLYVAIRAFSILPVTSV